MQLIGFAQALLLLFLSGCVTSLIIPEELPTILSLIYSNIPPIKKGTDSRVGIGFRLGEHADVQFLMELGPQRETNPIGAADAKRRRQATLDAAMNGELGPWAQSVAKIQTRRRLENELQEAARHREKIIKLRVENNQADKMSGDGGEWLTKWSKGMIESPDRSTPEESLPIQDILPNIAARKTQFIAGLESEAGEIDDKMKGLQKLFKPQPIAQNV